MYLAFCYQFEDFESYKHILVGYQNTQAIEACKAHHQHLKLTSLSTLVEQCRQQLLKVIKENDPTGTYLQIVYSIQ